VTIELLYFDGCPNHDELVPHIRELLAQAGIDATIELRRVETVEDAERERFLGSPTVRVDGRDVDPERCGARGLRHEMPALRDRGWAARHPAGRMDPGRAGGRMIARRAGRCRSAERAKPT